MENPAIAMLVKMADRRADRARCRWLQAHEIVTHATKYLSILSDNDMIDRRWLFLQKKTDGMSMEKNMPATTTACLSMVLTASANLEAT